jgi:hypothetical protein
VGHTGWNPVGSKILEDEQRRLVRREAVVATAARGFDNLRGKPFLTPMDTIAADTADGWSKIAFPNVIPRRSFLLIRANAFLTCRRKMKKNAVQKPRSVDIETRSKNAGHRSRDAPSTKTNCDAVKG